MGDGYRGLVGAFIYAFRTSTSVIFRVYVVVSTIVGVYVSLLIGLAIVAWSGASVAFGDQAFLAVIGIFLLVPLVTPVLVAARRHRRRESSAHADAVIALTGYGFILSIVLALFITDPADHAVSGPLGNVAAFLDGLPRATGLLPPLIATVLIVVAIRYT